MSAPESADFAEVATRVKDPVCGMRVDPATTPHHAMFEGEDFHFCGAGCRTKFVADPHRYLSPPPPAAPAPGLDGLIHTCPMHPQIRQLGPGACPICGMALEPALVTADAAPNPELVDMTRRFWVGLGLAAPLVVLAMGGPMLGAVLPVSAGVSAWLQFV